ITAGQAAHIRASITPAEAVQAARRELAAGLTEDLRGIDTRIRETRKTPATAVRAAGTSLTRLFRAGPVIAAARPRDLPHRAPVPRPDPLARRGRPRPDRGVLRRPQDLAAGPARQQKAPPRHPHGRGHPDPPPAQPRPRLLREEASRGQDPQGSPALPETAD